MEKDGTVRVPHSSEATQVALQSPFTASSLKSEKTEREREKSDAHTRPNVYMWSIKAGQVVNECG